MFFTDFKWMDNHSFNPFRKGVTEYRKHGEKEDNSGLSPLS